jgi:hypothetical protein
MACIAMKSITKILIVISILCLMPLAIYAQDREAISADNVGRLQSVQQIDYADFDADMDIGWFSVDESGTNFTVFDNDHNLYRISDSGNFNMWTYVTNPEEQLFAVIDGVYYRDSSFILYLIDDKYYVNSQELDLEGIPVNIGLGRDFGFIYVETNLDDGDTVIYEYGTTPITNELTYEDRIPYPLNDLDEPLMRVGRIDLPIVIVSSLVDNTIQRYYPGFSMSDQIYEIENGPAVFGTVNPAYGDSTYFAWVDPNSTYLNLLDLVTGENRVIADLNNLYAQYYLLSYDASLVIAVNVDFEPNVIAWDTNTGERYDLDAYRDCERIPDKVELSADGTTLVIGCDTGLDLWRIIEKTETD